MRDISLDNLLIPSAPSAFDTLPCVDFGFLDDAETPEQEQKRKAARYKKIAKRHDTNKVIIGEVIGTRENFAENRLIVTIEAPIKSNDFDGKKTVEAWIEASTPEGVVTLSSGFWPGKFVVIDSRNLEIIGACY